MTRSPLLVPVLLSKALSAVERRIGRAVAGSMPVVGARIEMRSAVPPLVALTASLMMSLPSPRTERVGVVAETAVEGVHAGGLR